MVDRRTPMIVWAMFPACQAVVKRLNVSRAVAPPDSTWKTLMAVDPALFS